MSSASASASASASITPISSATLPDDLLLLILARLPISTLFRFRAVSKSLNLLPISPHFIRLHLLLSPSAPTLLLSPPLSPLFLLSPPDPPSPLPIPSPATLRASSHGLLLLASLPHRGLYFVSNPSTRRHLTLPPTTPTPFPRCHPDSESTLAGLAVDPNTSHFLVLLAGFYRPFGRPATDQMVTQVYDSVSNTWKRSMSSIYYEEFTHMNRNQVVHANGMLHWLTSSCAYLLAFDLRDFLWRKVPLPVPVTGGRVYLLKMEAAVSVVQITGGWMCIWVLGEGERWALADRVNLRCIGGFAASVFPVGQTREVVFLATQKKVFTYGRREKVWREIYEVRGASAYPLWFCAHEFRSTLISC